MWISFPGFLSFRQRFVMLLKFVIENKAKDFTHLFDLTLGLRLLIYLPEANYVKTVIELNTSISQVVNWKKPKHMQVEV